MIDRIEATIFYMMEPLFSDVIEKTLKQLLDTKHLYQNLKVDFPQFETVFKSITPKLMSLGPHIEYSKPMVNGLYNHVPNLNWQLLNPNERKAGYSAGPDVEIEVSISFSPPSIRSFCHNCGEKEPYNFVNGADFLYVFPFNNPITQVFTLVYECQGCKDIPEVFLVRREKTKLTLSGRSPIEEIIVEPQIPKSHKKYMSDAILAFNSGQTLAGIFLLRTFIEQYVRSKNKTPETDNIELLFTDYASTLPDDFKNRFPSLKNNYDSLSVAIHLANPSDEVFLKVKEEIEHHFEGKKAFRIIENEKYQ